MPNMYRNSKNTHRGLFIKQRMSTCLFIINLYVYSCTVTPFQCKLSGKCRKFYKSVTQGCTSLCMSILQRITTFIMRSCYLISNIEHTKRWKTFLSAIKKCRKIITMYFSIQHCIINACQQYRVHSDVCTVLVWLSPWSDLGIKNKRS